MSRLLALPLMAIFIGILACGTTATEVPPTSAPAPSPVQSPTDAPASEAVTKSNSKTVPVLAPTPTTLPEPTSSPTEAPARAAVIVDQPEVGTGVGKILPHFEFTLADGTKRSTTQLSSQGRPVFLFFFTTW